MKLVIVGGVAGGAACATRARRLDAHAKIVVFERGKHVSYSNCALPYHLSDVIPDHEQLIFMTPKSFKQLHDIDVRTQSEVIAINREAKTVTVKDLQTNTTYEESYDKLLLSPGASPLRPRSIEGINNNNVFTVRSVEDICALKQACDDPSVKTVCVVGGGFIGLEVVENLVKAGKKTTLLQGGEQILGPFDIEMAHIVHKELLDKGVDLRTNTRLFAIEDSCVRVTHHEEEQSIPADIVVMAVGVAPETALAAQAGLAIGKTRGVLVDANYRTSDHDIYAVGDVIESYNAITREPDRLAMAGPAVKQGRAAADHMCGLSAHNKGFIGSSCIRVFSLSAACVGLSQSAAKAAGIPCDAVMVFPTDTVSIMPDSHFMVIKLIFEVPTGKIIGAQAIGKSDATKRINVIAAAMSFGATLKDLYDLELCYAPVFSTPKDAVTQAAMVGENILEGRFKQVSVTQARELVEKGAHIIDVRGTKEFERGHLKGAHNIPLCELRDRMDEIPRDEKVYIHCRSGQRSYFAICLLQDHGFTNVYNMSGSFLGISLSEYYKDVAEKRDPIVTNYNFS